MYGVTSLTQKGQVVIPKPIRDLFDLKAFDKIVFTVVKDKIMVEPALTVDEAYGMMASNIKPVSKKDMKAYIRQRVMEKHGRS
ncbi:MAG: AbrB/MazE/SpoVT family DNA-binding domain-containing protein [Candidatus Beckwithbacteria bacterium]|nr:AbrB/MazE/SpoVT family DNA-binding domain-containing protein [Patescibacteria group bacterium]